MSDECTVGHKVHQADGKGGMRGRDERGQWEDCPEVKAPGPGRNCTEHTHHDEPDSAGNVRGYDTQGRPWWCEVGTPTITVAGSDEAEQNAFEHAFPAIQQAVEQSQARMAAASASDSPAPAPVSGLTWTAGGQSQPIRQAVADLARRTDEEVFFRQEWLGGWTEGTPARPSWDEYFDGIAIAASRRADCTRRQVAALLILPTNKIIATGYNGPHAWVPGCATAGACPRGRKTNSEVPTRSSYSSGQGACIAIHAEANAVESFLDLMREFGVPRERAMAVLASCRMVVTCEPCPQCYALLAAVGITDVRWPRGSN